MRVSLLVVCSAAMFVGCAEKQPPQPETQSARKDVVDPYPIGTTSPDAVTEFPGNPASDSGDSPGTATPAQDSVPASVTVDQLTTANDPRAEFDRRRVELTGKVARPGHFSPVNGALALFLTRDGEMAALLGSSAFVTALFRVEGAADQLRTLSPHQEITVAGELRMAADKVWELHDAKLVNVQADPSIAVTASEITQAFLDDRNAAAAKYAGKPLRISGKVSGKAVPFGQYAAVMIAGAANADGRTTTVAAQFRPDHFNTPGTGSLNETSLVKLLPFAVGDEIEVRGMLQFANFGEGSDGQPALPLDAYPATWPLSGPQDTVK